MHSISAGAPKNLLKIVSCYYSGKNRLKSLPKSLVQKLLRHLRTPDRQSFMSGGSVSQWRFFVDEVTICIMLNHVARRVPPVIEDLRAEDMPANAPDGLVVLLGEPLVAEGLGVEIVHFE